MLKRTYIQYINQNNILEKFCTKRYERTEYLSIHQPLPPLPPQFILKRNHLYEHTSLLRKLMHKHIQSGEKREEVAVSQRVIIQVLYKFERSNYIWPVESAADGYRIIYWENDTQ